LAATGVWLSPSQAFAEARNAVDLIRDAAAKAPIKLHNLRRDVSILEGSGGHFRSAKARRESRALRRDRKGPRLGKQGPPTGHKDQYGCYVENDAARPAGIRENHRVTSKMRIR